MRMMAVIVVLVGALFAISPRFGFTADTTQPATQKVTPACCGKKCEKMTGCCKVDGQGKEICSMDGACCVKTKQ